MEGLAGWWATTPSQAHIDDIRRRLSYFPNTRSADTPGIWHSSCSFCVQRTSRKAGVIVVRRCRSILGRGPGGVSGRPTLQRMARDMYEVAKVDCESRSSCSVDCAGYQGFSRHAGYRDWRTYGQSCKTCQSK